MVKPLVTIQAVSGPESQTVYVKMKFLMLACRHVDITKQNK